MTGHHLRSTIGALSGLVLLITTGCGLSQSYREAQLKDASDYEVCMALTDPRQSSIGAGWAVRARAANAIATQRGLRCDYQAFSTIHTNEAPARAAQQEQNLMMMQMGTQMMQPQTPAAPVGGGAAVGTAFLKSSYVSGMNRVCLYDRMGSQVAYTVGAAQMCPITLQ